MKMRGGWNPASDTKPLFDENKRHTAEKELKAEKSARAGIPEMSKDIKELVVQMNRDPLLRYETLLQFQRSRMQEKGPADSVEDRSEKKIVGQRK
ncbi:MAG: hypothetical protein GY940_01015 [bacterium]|nr:hypothetical protein [bacterium]